MGRSSFKGNKNIEAFYFYSESGASIPSKSEFSKIKAFASNHPLCGHPSLNYLVCCAKNNVINIYASSFNVAILCVKCSQSAPVTFYAAQLWVTWTNNAYFIICFTHYFFNNLFWVLFRLWLPFPVMKIWILIWRSRALSIETQYKVYLGVTYKAPAPIETTASSLCVYLPAKLNSNNLPLMAEKNTRVGSLQASMLISYHGDGDWASVWSIPLLSSVGGPVCGRWRHLLVDWPHTTLR